MASQHLAAVTAAEDAGAPRAAGARPGRLARGRPRWAARLTGLLARRHDATVSSKGGELAGRIMIRAADAGDVVGLVELAALDEHPPLSGRVLVAEVAGAPRAALSLRGGQVVADPFFPSAELVSLLTLRAAQLSRTEAEKGGAARRPAGARSMGPRAATAGGR